MAVAHVAQRLNYSTTSSIDPHVITITNPTLISVGNHLVMTIGCSNARTVAGITDSRGNTWTIHESQDEGLSHRVTLASCKATTAYQAADTISVDLSATGALAAIVDEFSGLHATTWYAGGNAALNITPFTAWGSGVTDTAAAAGDLVYGALASDKTAAEVVVAAEGGTPTAWTVLTQAITGTRSAYGAYRIVAGTESPDFNGTWTTAARRAAAAIAVFRVAGGAPTSTARSFAVIVG